MTVEDEATLMRDRVRAAVIAGDPDTLNNLLQAIWEQGRVHGERWTEIAIGDWLDRASEIYADNGVVKIIVSHLASDVKKRKWRRPEFRSVVDEQERKT